MAIDLKTVHVGPESDIDRLLDEVEDRAFMLERHGVHYFVTLLEATPQREAQTDQPLDPPRLREVEGDDIWAGYDQERVRTALHEVAGSWSDVDAEELKAYLRRA